MKFTSIEQSKESKIDSKPSIRYIKDESDQTNSKLFTR